MKTPYKKLNVLIACEESQAECTAFRALGHNAYSCDILECRKGMHPEWHIKGDVSPFLHGETAFMFLYYVMTLANSSVYYISGEQICLPLFI